MKKIITILLLTLISLKAQETLPFSSLNFKISLQQNKNEVLLHQFWEPQSGLNFSVETPFYLGNIEAGISKIDFEGKLYIYPDFSSYFLFAGWSLNKQFFEFVSLKYGIRSGVFVMNFNDQAASEYESTESELSVSLIGELEFPVYKNISGNLNTELLTIFTDKRIKLFIVGVGLSYKLETPKWLRKFFE
ncbi:MAG: hypothetical protein JEY94_02870 [Melioribacteraceae bacterium]|nr:hypothetical protein [Melioribacteraceae bacterium]